jgi:F0F1-type ATP synthase membrane subunit b/b'
MAADDHIRRTFDTLAERLRDEISRQLDEFSGPLAASLDEEREDVNTRLSAALAEKDRLAAALAEADDRLAVAQAAADDRLAVALTEADGRVAEAVAETKDRVADAVASAQSRHAETMAMVLAASERLADALRTMDRARSLSEILDTLASCAGREAARVSVLVVRGSQLRAWRFIGFGPRLDEATQYEMPMADAGIIADAVRTGVTVSGDSGSMAAHASPPSFAELPPGRETLALPVPMSGQVVAVLYADQGPGDIAEGADVAAPALLSWPASLEVITRHAARCLEAVTAYRAAQVLTERPDAPAASKVPPAADVAPATADDEQGARRFARLLISEIKLYHEAEVLAGRRERDLASRLGGEIARARVLYEQRVPAPLRQSTDYFHDELVRTLADGDHELIA